MASLENLEASLQRYLYTNLELAKSIKVFESVNQVDFTSFTKWVVIDTLTNNLGAEPKQLIFLHIATQKGLKNEKAELTKLVDTVLGIIDFGFRIDVYSYTTGLVIGEMEVSDASLSAVMQHPGGGAFRTLSLGLVY